MKRILLFFLTNILVIVTLSITLSLLGVTSYLGTQGINFGALLIFCLIWGMGGAFISLSISRWTAKVLMKVQLVDKKTTEARFLWLYEKVKSISSSQGLPMPQVGIYQSRELNAFATGPSKNKSLVAVSTGLLLEMSDEEIEGVLGHEIAHIKNGDMVTMTLIQGVINAFVMFLARIISWVVTSRLEKGGYAINFLLRIILEIVFSLFGFMLVAWFSRKREYIADRGSADTVGRSKMISALKSLQSHANLREKTRRASFANFKIDDRPAFTKLFSTHPPLEDRIEKLQS